MPMIRIPVKHWGKVWRALIATGPISRFTEEPIYLVSERHVRMLRRKKLPFKLVDLESIRRRTKGRKPPLDLLMAMHVHLCWGGRG